MTSHTGRLYAVAVALVVFFLTWAAVAARPWASAKADPRLVHLAARERHVRHESLVVRRIVRRRWAVYRAQLKHRQAQIAAAQAAAQRAAALQVAAQQAQQAQPSAPAVRVVNLPPLTITRTS
jgi:hypothetical protein